MVVTGKAEVRRFCTVDTAGAGRVSVARTASACTSKYSEILPFKCSEGELYLEHLRTVSIIASNVSRKRHPTTERCSQ